MKLNHQVRRWSVVVGLAFGVLAAQAQDGFTVKPHQESLVKPGMSKSEVQQVIGRPSQDQRYGMAPGSTWVYNVSGVANVPEIVDGDRTVYEVDFDANGRVISARERTLHSSEQGGGTAGEGSPGL